MDWKAAGLEDEYKNTADRQVQTHTLKQQTFPVTLIHSANLRMLFFVSGRIFQVVIVSYFILVYMHETPVKESEY